MMMTVHDIETQLGSKLSALGFADAAEIAWSAAWLEACGYSGIALLGEALADYQRTLPLARDSLGLDLQNVSCAFLAPAIMREVAANGRAFLRNVRHGLFLLPYTVKANIGIGCPIDPGFAVGGERHKNPYAEKLALAEADGLDVDVIQLSTIELNGR